MSSVNYPSVIFFKEDSIHNKQCQTFFEIEHIYLTLLMTQKNTSRYQKWTFEKSLSISSFENNDPLFFKNFKRVFLSNNDSA